MQLRKKDTRDKIELGGLVVKAGLRETDKAVVLGILMEAASKLSSQDGDNLTEYYRKIGDEAFIAGGVKANQS